LPPEIQLEVETLIADLRGERWLPFPPADEGLREALDDHERDVRQPGALRAGAADDSFGLPQN
jgi:hypothetical protein